MSEVILETVLDTIKTIPFLFVVYVVIELVQKRINAQKIMGKKLDYFGPVLGASVGCIPQCGFSAASAALYNERIIGGGTLIAVFLSTSDEAIPVILSNLDRAELVIYLIVAKIIIAIAAGYLLKFTLFRNEVLAAPKEIEIEYTSCERKEHHEHHGSVVKDAIYHTIKISAYILVTLLVINVIIFYLGEERLAAVLLSNSLFQPLITAFIGLVPGCTTSVLLTELMLAGSISFGAGVAGLCTGAGFGYIVLFKGSKNMKTAFKVVGATYVVSAVAGILIDLFFRIV